MSDEEKKAAEIEQTLKDAKARKDAEQAEGGKLDKILAGLDAMNTKCDTLTSRMDAIETGSKAEKDGEDDLPAEPEARADAIRKHHDAVMTAQARWDSVAGAFGERAPKPLAGESELNYRRRVANHYQHHSAAFKSVDLGTLPGPAFGPVEEIIYADALKASANPGGLPDGRLREVVTVDSRTGVRMSHFFGNHTFIRDLMLPARRVARFNTQQTHA